MGRARVGAREALVQGSLRMESAIGAHILRQDDEIQLEEVD